MIRNKSTNCTFVLYGFNFAYFLHCQCKDELTRVGHKLFHSICIFVKEREKARQMIMRSRKLLPNGADNDAHMG